MGARGLAPRLLLLLAAAVTDATAQRPPRPPVAVPAGAHVLDAVRAADPTAVDVWALVALRNGLTVKVRREGGGGERRVCGGRQGADGETKKRQMPVPSTRYPPAAPVFHPSAPPTPANRATGS